MLAPRSLLLSAALAALVLAPAASAASCSSYSTRYGKNLDGVCVCTAASCDEVSNDYLTLTSDQVGVFQTSKGGDRLSYTTVPAYAANSTAAASNVVEVTVDSSVTYQKITGFGGAFTDTTTSNVYKMSSTLQDKIVSAYFGDKGIQYTLGRVPIGSTDFSESIYSYNPVEGDLDMVNFSIDIDKSASTHKIEFIKRALAASSRAVPLFASSWAPPVWMTREKSVLGNATVIGEPGEPYWKALALYYSRFFDEYKKEGINFWAMTTQNEPSYQFAFLEWQQLRFTTEQERDFIKKDLGPLMKKNHPDLKIIMMDDQKDLLPTWRAALEDPEARQYVSGVGVHWYKNIDFIADGLGNFQQLADFNAKYPDIFILPSEACSGSMPSIIGTGAGVRIQEPDIIWKRAENYARDIINDLANFAVGWTDWNMVLDTTGGPTWVGNFVDAPIIIDEKSGNEFYKQPMYYIMGHVAKFLPAGSQRVALSAPKASGNVDRVAFRTPAGQLVVILQNRDASPVSLKVSDTQGKVTTSVTLPANSVQTILFAAPGATTPAPTTTAPVTTAPATTVPATTAPVTTAPATTTPATTTPATTPCPLPTPTEPATTPVTTPVSTPVTTPVTTPVSTPVTTPVTTPVATSVTTPCPLPSPTTPATTTPAPTRSYC